MSQQPHEPTPNHSDDPLSPPLGHQNPLGVHYGLGQLGLQTKGLVGGSSLSILDPDIFFPNGLPEIDLSSDEVTSTNQSAPSEQAISTTPPIQPQRIEHSQSHQTDVNQILQQQSSQPTHQLNKQPSNQVTNSASQLQTNPSNIPAIQPSLDNAPDQSSADQARSSSDSVQRFLSDQPGITPQSAQSLEQTQPAAESSSPPTIQAKEITPESNSAELSEPNQATYPTAESAQPKPIKAVSKAQSSRKQQSSNSPQKGTEKLTHTDIQRYFDPELQTSADNSFSDHSVSNLGEQVVQAKPLVDTSNSDSSSASNVESGLVGTSHSTGDIDSGDAIAPAQPSLTTSDQQRSRSASEPISYADQRPADNNFAASDSTSHSKELPAPTPEAPQQTPPIQRAAASDSSSQVNPVHQPLATSTASEQAKTNLNQEVDTSSNPTSHSDYSDQADTIINRKTIPSSTSNDSTGQESSASSDVGSTEVRSQPQHSIQRDTETAAATPESHTPPPIQQESKNLIDQFNSSAALSATSDNQPSTQAQIESGNTPVENQTNRPNNQQTHSAQINLDQVKIQQKSDSENINRSSSISEQHNSYSEAVNTAEGQPTKDNLEPTVSTGQSVDSVQSKFDIATKQSISFTQSKTDLSSYQSVSQPQPESVTNKSVKPIQKVGHAVNRLMRFFANQINSFPIDQTNQLDQAASAETQQSESVDTSTALSEDSKIEPSTLSADLGSNLDTQPIQRSSETTSDLNKPEDLNNPEHNVPPSQFATESKTIFSSVNSEVQPATSTPDNQAVEANAASSRLTAELQSQPSSSLPSNTLQRSEQPKIETFTGSPTTPSTKSEIPSPLPLSNFVEQSDIGSAATSASPINAPENKAFTRLADDTIQTKTDSSPVSQIETSITSETTADSQPTNIQRVSALNIEDAIAVSSAPTTLTPTTSNETVQRFTDSNFTAPDEAAQLSHTTASNLSEHSLENNITAYSSLVSPIVQQPSTEQNILNRNTDEMASTRKLSATQPVYRSSENPTVNEQRSFSNEVPQEEPGSLLGAASGIQASHLSIGQTSSSEQSAQEVQKVSSEGAPSIQASSAQTAESQTAEQPDLQLQQYSDLGSRSLPELENKLQRKPESESTAISETETTARPSVNPDTTPQPTAQTPSIQAQSTQSSSTQPVPEQLADLGFHQPSAQAPTVQAQSTQTDSELATVDHPEQAQSTQVPSVQAKPTQADPVDHPEQTQPSTPVPSVQAQPVQADSEQASSEHLEPIQPSAETPPTQVSPAQSPPAQTPSIQAQTAQSGVEQGSEHVELNQPSAPELSVQAKSTQANLDQKSSEDLELNQLSTPVPSVQAKPIQTNLEPAGSGQPKPLQSLAQTPSVQAKSTQTSSAQASFVQVQSSRTDSVQSPFMQAESAQVDTEQAASATDQQVDQTPITVLRPIGILRSLTTAPISTTAIQSKASQDKQIQPQVNTQPNIQRQNMSLEPSSYQDQSPAEEELAGDSWPQHTASNAYSLQRQITATEPVLNESADAVQFQQANNSYAAQPESNQGLADIQRQPSDQVNQTNQVDSNPNLAGSSHSNSPAAEQDSSGIPASDLVQRSVEQSTANYISTDQPNQPVINRSLADAVNPAANQQSIQPESLFDTSVNQTSGTSTTSETSNQPEIPQPRAYHLSASPQVEQPGDPRTRSQEARSTSANFVQRSNAKQTDQEASTQPNPASDQIQHSPSAKAHQVIKPLAEPAQPVNQEPDDIQRDRLIDNSQLETATQPVQSFSQQQAGSIQRNQLDSPPPADSSLEAGVPTQWSSLADLVEQTQRLSAPTPTEFAPEATSELPDVQRQVDSSRAADSETIQDSTVDVIREEGGAIAPPTPPSPSSSIPTQWSSLEDLMQQMPSLESSADTARQQAETAQPSQIQRKSTFQIQKKTPQASSAVSSQQKSPPKSQSTLQPVRQAGKPRSTLSVSRVAPAQSSQRIPATQTQVQAKFNPLRANSGATVIQASEDEPFVTISRSGGGSEAVADYAEALELLAQEIYSLLRQRLAIEQERHGAGYPNRFR